MGAHQRDAATPVPICTGEDGPARGALPASDGEIPWGSSSARPLLGLRRVEARDPKRLLVGASPATSRKLAFPEAVYLVDAIEGGKELIQACQPTLESDHITKVIHDCKRDREALYFQFGIKLHNVMDTQVTITIYDWDTVCKCKVIGSVTIAVLTEDETGASWYELDSKFGQICLRLHSTKAFPDSDSFEECTGVESPRKMILKKQRQTMIEGIGPLQTIYKLPHDKIVHQSYSCALERRFLHHGRMYISQWHLCFHSNVFSKQLNVVIPLQDIDEIKRSQHSLINPSITIFLKS